MALLSRRARVMRPAGVRRYSGEPLALPWLRLHLRRADRASARGLPGEHPVERGARGLGLPGLRCARAGRLRAARGRVGRRAARGGLSPMATMERTPERTPYALAARELLRNTLLDGARDELQRRPWAEITMADIAATAGVSRQTLYKEFGSRE